MAVAMRHKGLGAIRAFYVLWRCVPHQEHKRDAFPPHAPEGAPLSFRHRGTHMSLMTTIEADYLVAYKAKDALTVGVLRMLKTALKNFQVEHRRTPEDADVLDVIARQCKQRQESATQFLAADRPELADKENIELEVLRRYMPEPLEGDALTAAIREAVAATNATGVRDMGKVMQALMAAHKGRIDGKAGSEAVKNILHAL